MSGEPDVARQAARDPDLPVERGVGAAPASMPASAPTTAPGVGWFLLVTLLVVGVHLLAGLATGATIGAMRGITPFADAMRAWEMDLLRIWRPLAYTAAIAGGLLYLQPLMAHFRGDSARAAPPEVQRRAIGAPAVIALISFAPWALSTVVFPGLTLVIYGRWTPELLSQQVFSPLVNGVLAATTSYLLLDWRFRRVVVPRVFPDGRLPLVPQTLAPGVHVRLLLFLFAVAFLPLFTMLGLVRAAAMRVRSGRPAAEVLAELTTASGITFAFYVVLGIALTMVLARTITWPLASVVTALRRVRQGDRDVAVAIESGDELGALQDGVNAMVEGLREKEHILQAFGRVVEPSIRDQLLAGTVGFEGELRAASVLFCDLRGFTALAERTRPEEVVGTLNEFFTVMTTWVRGCGGFVDKFIGDAMLVVFGLFESAGPDAGARDALRCALGMRDRLTELNAARAGAEREALAMSVAIHSGEVLAGTIGAADRHEFTVIGDTVNVAARLQRLCKEEGCTLLVSERTYELAHGVDGLDALTARDAVTLPGRSAPVRVFGLG